MTPATILEHDGVSQSITEWALDYGIIPAIIIGRLERGMSIADAITTPMKTGHRGQRLASSDMESFIRRLAKPSVERPKKVPVRLRRRQTYTHAGKTMTIPEWSAHSGVKVATIRFRLHSGWTFARSIEAGDMRSKPRLMTRAQLAREGGVEPRTVESRLRRGWPLELAMTEPPGARMGRYAHGRPGVPSDFPASNGTGGGSTLQETSNITFSGNDA
jgi:hypothetical protein